MEMTKEVIEVPFEGVAVRKLHDLFERGYTVCGVAIQRIHQSGNFDRGAITTGGMVMWWLPEQHKSEPVPAPKNLYQITGNVADVNTVLIERAELHRLQAENNGLRILASGGIDLFERYSTFKAKCAELEAMLDAVGAGGVGQSIKPQVQADTAPAAWAIYSDDGTAIRLWSRDKATAQEAADKIGLPLVALYAAPQQPVQQKPVAWIEVKPNPFDPSCRGAASVQDHALPPGEHKLYTAPKPTENLHCKSTQKRLATLWGYVKKEPDHFRDATQMVPARQPLTEDQIKAAVRHLYGSDAVAAMAVTGDIETARAIEAAHGITGGQQ